MGSTSLATDQRGVVRPVGPDFDIGAFESGVDIDIELVALQLRSVDPIDVNTAFDVFFDITVENNAGVDPVDADVSVSLTAPPDCVVTAPGPQTVTISGLNVPVDLTLAFGVICNQTSFHDFTGTASVALADPDLDPILDNNDGGPVTITRPVIPPAIVLIIDEDSIDNGLTPFENDEDVVGFNTAEAVNDDVAEIGVRAQLRFFAANIGETITLRTGEVGDEGWFALTEDPPQWEAAGGVRGYLGDPSSSPETDPPHGVGPGLGAEDDEGDREALLDKIDGVTPLRAAGLELLTGEVVCAVVYDSDVSINYDDPINGSLKGANHGTVAFEVLSVTAVDEDVDQDVSDSSLPKVEILILDAEEVCLGPLELFTEAPELESSSEPFDVVP